MADKMDRKKGFLQKKFCLLLFEGTLTSATDKKSKRSLKK
jgi:hypothetical protein